MTEFWEPWHPKVGDRVRVHVSGECTFHHLGNGHITPEHDLLDVIRSGGLGGPGFQGANGSVGTVQHICSDDDGDGHLYYVSDTEAGHWKQVDDFFAAIELELLPDESEHTYRSRWSGYAWVPSDQGDYD